MDIRDDDINIKVNIDNHESYFEAYTDFIGIQYHLIYISLITNINIKLLLEIELQFMRNQATILNRHLHLGKVWNKEILIPIKQLTPAFSYYILKYLLFEYSLYNNIELFDNNDYNKIFNKIINIGFNDNQNIYNINSSRMTLLQLN
jgi:hypothetical protein